MSLLSVFEATPNRVRALSRLVATLNDASRQSLREHFMPDADNASQFNNLLRETTRLGLISEVDGKVALVTGVSVREIEHDETFLALVEKALLTDVADGSDNKVLRYALAWLLTQPIGTRIGWNSDQHLNMQAQMQGEDCYDVTNKERFAMLCYWARYLGYAEALLIGDSTVVVPDPTEALARHLASAFEGAPKLPIARFFEAIARLCPVLELGAIRAIVEKRMTTPRAPNMLSSATGLALWRLESRGTLRLSHASDAETWLLSPSVSTAGAGTLRTVSHIEYHVPA